MDVLTGQTTIDEFLGLTPKPQHERKAKTPKPATSAITKRTRKASNDKTKRQPLHDLVIDTLGSQKMTAREIACEMHAKGYIPYPARAVIQPRITELVESGRLKAVGEKTDTQTQRKVAMYKVV